MRVTIEHAQEAKEQDIFFPGNVLVSKEFPDNVIVVLADWVGDSNRFCGVYIGCMNYYSRAGHENYLKECFEQFHGKIILEK